MDVEELRVRLAPLLRRYGVKRAGVFGSMARGEATGDSDIDLLVEFKGSRSLLDLAGIKVDAEELLGKKVDVITYKSIHPLLRARILSEQKALI
jgi:uncharacterized protein